MPAKRGSDINLHQLSNAEVLRIAGARWRARTDMVWLCNQVLKFPDVSQRVHGPMIDRCLQRFPRPGSRLEAVEHDQVVGGQWKYKPLIANPYDLKGPRRALILDARGHLKTSLNCIAHTIQFLLNYPDLAIAIFHGVLEKAEMVLDGIKQPFKYNSTFRSLFPEYCPEKKIDEWGTKAEIWLECISAGRFNIVPSVFAGSVDKSTTGYHFDVMKFTDMVDETNINMQDQLSQAFASKMQLVVRPDSWAYLEGTRWFFHDMYGVVIDAEMKKPASKRIWSMFTRSCYKREMPDGKEQSFTPDDFQYPLKQPLESWWPERWSVEALEEKRADPHEGPLFAANYLNNPSEGLDKAQIFPVDKSYPKWISKDDFARVPIAHWEMTNDFAQTQKARSDFSCHTMGAWSVNGKLYIVEIRHGKFTPEEIIANVINMYLRYKPYRIKMEKDAFYFGIEHNFLRYGELHGIVFPFEEITRARNLKKTDRIAYSLQEPYKNGEVIFVEGCCDAETRHWLLQELDRFGHFDRDDILDTLADFFIDKMFHGRARPRSKAEAQKDATYRFQQMQQAAWKKLIDGPEGPGFGVTSGSRVPY